MAQTVELLIASDLHYAGVVERTRTNFESTAIARPGLRHLARWYRKYIWLHDPLGHYVMLDKFIEQSPRLDFTVFGGDYSCDSAFVGLSDDGAHASVQECLARLRQAFSPNVAFVIGDHELGKFSVFGKQGGMRLASYHRAVNGLQLTPFWRKDFGAYVLLGVTSSIVALPIFEPETLAEDLDAWREIRVRHLAEISAAFASLRPEQRVLLFCHDPTALPFLAELPEVKARLGQIEATVLGHLHSELVLRTSRILSGMPRINFLGSTVSRLSAALAKASQWRPFHVRLCPSLTGIELLRDGGYLTATLDPAGVEKLKFKFHSLPWGD